jgi:hypothetical protein
VLRRVFEPQKNKVAVEFRRLCNKELGVLGKLHGVVRVVKSKMGFIYSLDGRGKKCLHISYEKIYLRIWPLTR